MRKSVVGLFSLALASGLVVGQSSLSSAAAPPTAVPGAATAVKGAVDRPTGSDEVVSPLDAKRRALRQTAVTGVLKGTVTPEQRGTSTVAKVGTTAGAPAAGLTAGRATGDAGTGRDQYVELARTGKDKILVVLAEFGDKRDPRFPDKDINPATPGPVTWDGPLHNTIPKPGVNDNSTVWQADYDVAHYQELYFGSGEESLKSFYERQSSGRYSVGGEVVGWVKVPYNEARYGRSTAPDASDPNVCQSNVCTNSQALVTDAITALVNKYKAQGKTTAQIRAELASFDQQDRYDYDGDGNFNEPDGYIDHFQVVHAGGDESDGDPTYGEDALWAHRWYVNSGGAGTSGPVGNKLGGSPVGDTGLFVGDYTMQPENGGVSVFTHEYAHDLGLPDHYDTAGGDNGVDFWNLMAQSRLNAAGEPLGTRAGDLSAWDKLQLGWLNYDTVRSGQNKTVDLGPSEYNSGKPQAIVDVLPDKEVTIQLGAPFAGKGQYFSGNADDLSSNATVAVDLTGTTGVFSSKVRYNIEEDFDYLYVQTSTDGGKNWTSLPGTVGGKPFGKNDSGFPAVTGSSDGKWVGLSVPLTTLAGKKGLVRFAYRTDGGVSAGGFFADDLKVTAGGATVFTDNAEAAPKATLNGFSIVGSSTTKDYANFYIASNRSYVSYDKYLETGPYNFGFLDSRPDFVEHFAYQKGLLVLYWDTSQGDNNTSEHPGQALVLPVDAHPAPLIQLDGGVWRARVQTFDAPFSLRDTASFTLHLNSQPQNILGSKANPTFDDTVKYYRPNYTPLVGQVLPKAGVKMTVVSQQGTSMTVKVGSSAPQG